MLTVAKATVVFNAGTPLERRVINELDLTVQTGEVITVVGSNGAGKSSLFKLLSGLHAPAAGSIYLGGIEVTAWPQHRRAALVASVTQDPRSATLEPLTIEENLNFALLRGKQRGLLPHSQQQRKAYFCQKLAPLKMGLEDRLAQPVGSLSGGQRQALSLVMATLTDAKLLLLDEHTAALDPATARLVMQLTDQIIKECGITALIITHNMSDALTYGSRTLVLKEGRIAHDLRGAERACLKPEDLIALMEG